VRPCVIIIFVCLTLLLITSADGQSPNGTISGLIIDSSGSVIVGADILIANDATGVQYSAKTNDSGIYVASNLPPGKYRLQVSKTGFKTLIKPGITLNVQDALAINFTLPVGAVSEIVTVTAGAPLVNTQSASVSTVIDRTFVQNLPLNGRSFNTLLQLTPGVVIAQVPLNNQAPGQFSIAGQRTDANNFTVDGVSADFGVPLPGLGGESGTGGAQAFSVLGGTSSLVSVDALQEFRIETSSFAPEFGRTPGGQVILTTRSGTDDFHGGAFDYFRNTVMDANDWFAKEVGEPRAPEHHNDFGGFLGGPLRRNKTFFFFSYEGARLDQPQTQQIEVPSEYARATASATLAPYVDAYPQPGDRTATPGVYAAVFTGNYANRATLDATSVRIDHLLSERFSLFGRYNYAPSESLQRQFSLSNLASTNLNTQTLTIGLNMAFRDGIANTVRGNYSTQSAATSYALDSFGGAVPLNASLLFGSLPSTSNLALFETLATSSSYLLGSDGRNQTKQANFTDDLTLPVGTHQIKIGGDYRAIFLDEKPPQFNPEYFAQDFQTFLTTGSVSLSTATSVTSSFLAQSLGLYAQDTWRVNSKLSLTYGLRWELSPAPSARGKTTLASWVNTNNPGAITLAPSGTPLWASTYDNFAPRLGVVYALTSKGDFVVRAGGGIFYDLGVGAASSLALQFPNSSFGFFPSVSLPVPDLTPFLPTISLSPPYPDPVQGFAQDLRLPRSYQWNVALEKSFGRQQVFSATYVGQAGRDLLRQQALVQPNANFAGDFLLTLNDAWSNYDALQLQLRRPLASGLQVLLNYTWSHSLDNASNDVVTALSNSVISGSRDYSSSSFDVRQSFSGAFGYDLPAAARSRALVLLTQNWSLQAVAVARTGLPFNGVVLLASPGGVLAESRPDLVTGQPLWIANSAAPGGKSLNPAAFSVPSPPRRGTEGRNDIPGFGLTQVDLSVGRTFPITERLHLQFRADAFNLLNHPNFANPLAFVEFGTFYLSSTKMLNQGLGGLSPLFQEGGPRSLQLSLKLTF
jgi:hypothetical protein